MIPKGIYRHGTTVMWMVNSDGFEKWSIKENLCMVMAGELYTYV